MNRSCFNPINLIDAICCDDLQRAKQQLRLGGRLEHGDPLFHHAWRDRQRFANVVFPLQGSPTVRCTVGLRNCLVVVLSLSGVTLGTC